MPHRRRLAAVTLALALSLTLTAAAPALAAGEAGEGPTWSFLQTLHDHAVEAYHVVVGHLPGADPGETGGGNPHEDGSGREGESPHMDPNGVSGAFF